MVTVLNDTVLNDSAERTLVTDTAKRSGEKTEDQCQDGTKHIITMTLSIWQVMAQGGYKFDYEYDWGNKVPKGVPSGLNLGSLFNFKGTK